MEIKSLDNIDDKVLDLLKEKFNGVSGYRVVDNKEKDKYFLFGKTSHLLDNEIEYTFIWIGNNIWQYRFTNVHCTESAMWVNPLELLNSIVNH